eukprot:4443950-Amphidinium_carterae.1
MGCKLPISFGRKQSKNESQLKRFMITLTVPPFNGAHLILADGKIRLQDLRSCANPGSNGFSIL